MSLKIFHSSRTLTKWMIPAAVNQTEMNIEMSWANRIDVDVFKMFRYCKMSGTVIKRRARRNRKPEIKRFTKIRILGHFISPNILFWATSFRPISYFGPLHFAQSRILGHFIWPNILFWATLFRPIS